MEEKIKKNLKNDMLVLAILYLLLIVFQIITYKTINFDVIKSAIFATLLFFGYIKAKNGDKIAGIIGLVVGILMMLTIINIDIIDFLLGLFVFIHSLKYSKHFN